MTAPDEDTSELYFAPLPELLSRADGASPNNRIVYRDPIAGYGTDAIDGVWPWLTDRRLCAFAAVVIRRVGELGGKKAAREALLRALDEAPESFKEFLEGQLVLIGGLPAAPPPVPANTLLTPIGPGAGAHHIIRDYLATNSTEWGDLYLLECGRYFSGGWVRDHNGPLEVPEGPACTLCIAILQKGKQP